LSYWVAWAELKEVELISENFIRQVRMGWWGNGFFTGMRAVSPGLQAGVKVHNMKKPPYREVGAL
jgi:hypothetical protein